MTVIPLPLPLPQPERLMVNSAMLSALSACSDRLPNFDSLFPVAASCRVADGETLKASAFSGDTEMMGQKEKRRSDAQRGEE